VENNVWFITPVHERYLLTSICLEQRARFLRELPFEAHAVIIGDDDNMKVARELGLDTVEKDNEFVGAKFNAGYKYAIEHGATHCMAIGSDSWMHPSVFHDMKWGRDKDAIGLVGLSSFSPDGEKRVDLSIRYPAGFGVGMLYPVWALHGGEACRPDKQKGIDTSTWQRCGWRRLRVVFQDSKLYTYLNFHSPDEQITSFRKIVSHGSRTGSVRTNGTSVLDGMYDADLVERLREMYALRSLECFLTGKEMTEPEVKYTPAKGRWPKSMAKMRSMERAQELAARRFAELQDPPPR
jgi:hypothetical protein